MDRCPSAPLGANEATAAISIRVAILRDEDK